MDRDELTMLLARNIQALIEEQGKNAAQVTREAKVNQTGLYDILSGKSKNPRLDTIAKIAGALGVSVASLLREKSDDEIRNQILRIIDDLPREERERLLVTARAWVSPQSPA